MDEKFYSVDDISTMLGIHPKTTRRYITKGKLRAAKIGKQYRIAGHDLSVFLERHGDAAAHTAMPQTHRIDVSAVVDIAVANQDRADRISATVLAAANAKDPAYGQSTVNIQQNGNKLRVMLWGTVRFITAMLECVDMMNDQNQQSEA